MGQTETLYRYFGSESDFFILQRTGFEVKLLNLNLKQRSIFLGCSLNF